MKITDTAILDGQQRLTSLFISLFGCASIKQKYSRKNNSASTFIKLFIELNKHKLNVDEEEYNSKKYDIRFTEKIGKLSPTQFEIKKILEDKYRNDATRKQAIEDAIVNVPSDSKEYARNILNKLYSKIFVEKLVRYTEIKDMRQDDALEMFVRFNSGGKVLKKHEITMFILEAYWPNSKSEIGNLLIDSYSDFGTDFVIRTALMLYGDVIKSTINKEIAENLKNNWSYFKETLNNLEKVLKEMKIEVSHFSSSWNVLLPIIYFMYYNTKYTNNLDGIKAYLIRAVLFTYFQSGTTSKLQQMKSNINDNDCEISIDMLEQINELRVTDGKIEDIVNREKGRVVGEVLYFLSLDWRNKNYKYEQDHLHPYARFDGVPPFSVSMDDWRKWRNNRNRLPNIHLLEGRSNGSKNYMRLVDYYNDMNEEQKENFCKEAIIPKGVSFEFEKFEDFYEKRKALLKEKNRELLG